MDLVNNNWMEPLFGMALVEAQFSPCVRRQYAAMAIKRGLNDNGYTFECRNNSRVTRACKNGCIRDKLGIKNGNHIRTELGAELHAEQALLIDTNKDYWDHLLLVGISHGHELLGEDVFPCLVCARMIKYAGYKNVFMRNKERVITAYSIEEIISYQEEVLVEND